MAAYGAITNPQSFADAQVPGTTEIFPISNSATITILQTGNIYLLLAALAVLCCLFSTPRAARNYLLILACADLGHMYSVYSGLGEEAFFDVRKWNDMVWGHVGVSSFLFVNRLATAAGVFGTISRQSVKRN